MYTATDGAGNQTSDSAQVTVDHDQNGITDPLELSMVQIGGGTRASWIDAGSTSISYNVIRGELSLLKEQDLAIDLDEVVCVESGSTDTTTAGYEDTLVPAPGEGFFYLVEYNDGAFLSSYGSVSASKPRLPKVGDCQ